jgi:saccharopine dehydrogenase-like NADP-dependent oxidoreductase
MVEYLHGHGANLTVAALEFAEAVSDDCAERDIPMEAFRAGDEARLGALMANTDLVVSLLPATMHLPVAKACVAARRHLVTPNPADEATAALDGPARKAGILLLHECGLDPGLDHMAAMRVIHEVRKQGGEVTALASCCGVLPAPDANDTPFGCKFSASPRGALLAARDAARYLRRGEVVEVPGPERFTDRAETYVEGAGMLEMHPRSRQPPLPRHIYATGAADMFRGAFSYPGHCSARLGFVRLGLLDADTVRPVSGMTWRDLILALNPTVKLGR